MEESKKLLKSNKPIMLIQLNKSDTDTYNYWLNTYRFISGKSPTYVQRTECFLSLQNNNTPSWIYSS